jgi:hypothetical protein
VHADVESATSPQVRSSPSFQFACEKIDYKIWAFMACPEIISQIVIGSAPNFRWISRPGNDRHT